MEEEEEEEGGMAVVLYQFWLTSSRDRRGSSSSGTGLLWQCAIPDRAGPIVNVSRPFARSSRPGSIDRQWEGKKLRRRKGESTGRNSPRFFPPRIVQGSRLSNAIVPFCSFARRMLRRLAHAHSRIICMYTRVHVHVYTGHDERRKKTRRAR